MVPSTELSGCSARDSNSARCQLRSITTETIAIPITTTTAATTVITRPTITRDRRRLGGTAVTSVAGIVMVTSSADGILGRAHQSPPADSSLSQRARRGQRTRFQRLRAREARRRYVGSIALTANASGPPPTERAVPRPLYSWADSTGHGDTELSNNSAKASAGFFHPSVLRGRSLSSSATLSRSAWVCNDRSVPFGKYCRNKPLVFSLVPRCHGE